VKNPTATSLNAQGYKKVGKFVLSFPEEAVGKSAKRTLNNQTIEHLNNKWSFMAHLEHKKGSPA
jgi:hypothetical protein